MKQRIWPGGVDTAARLEAAIKVLGGCRRPRPATPYMPWASGTGGPHQGLDGIRLKLQHPLQVKRLGVPLDGDLPPLLGGASPRSSLVA